MRKTWLFLLMLATISVVFSTTNVHAKNVHFIIDTNVIGGNGPVLQVSKPDLSCYYTDTQGKTYECSFDTPKCEEIYRQCLHAVCEIDAVVNPEGDYFVITKIKSIKVVKKYSDF